MQYLRILSFSNRKKSLQLQDYRQEETTVTSLFFLILFKNPMKRLAMLRGVSRHILCAHVVIVS